MNALFALNRQILDVNGRLALLGPSKDVAQILQSAGIYNFLKVYDTESELLKSSDDIIVQTSSYNLSSIRTMQAESVEPAVRGDSDFEDFRSGIADAFDTAPAQPSRPKQPPSPAPEPPRMRAPQKPAAPVAEPVFDLGDESEAFVSRPQAQKAPTNKAPQGMPKGSRPVEQPSFGQESFDEPAFKPSKKPEPAVAPKASKNVDRWEEEIAESKSSKKSAMPVVIGVAVFVLLAAAAIIIVPGYMESNKNKDVSAAPEAAKIPQVASVPAAEPSPAAPEAVAPATQPAQVAQRQAESAPVPRDAAQKPVAEKPRATYAPVASAPPPAAPSAVNKLVVQSIPSGARVILNNNPRGETPLEIDNPPKAKYRLIVSKDGFTTKVMSIEFRGGYQEENVELAMANEPAPEPAAAPYSPPPPPPPPPAPVAAPAPAASSAPSGDPATIFISSIPPVADVYLDGRLIGKTNITKLNVFTGTHTMRFSKNGKEVTKDMTFSGGENPSVMVKIQ